MSDERVLRYVRTRVQPDTLDVETAKRMILEHLHSISQATFEPVGSSQLISQVTLQKQSFSRPISIEAGYEPALEEDITGVRAILAAREALLSLHADGILLPYASLIIGDAHASEEMNILVKNTHPNSFYGYNTWSIGPIHLPSALRDARRTDSHIGQDLPFTVQQI